MAFLSNRKASVSFLFFATHTNFLCMLKTQEKCTHDAIIGVFLVSESMRVRRRGIPDGCHDDYLYAAICASFS